MFFYSESMASAISSGHTDANISDFVDQHWALPVARLHQSTHHLLYNMRVLFGCMLEVDLPILCSYHWFAFQQHSFPKQLPQNCLLLTNDYTSPVTLIASYTTVSYCTVFAELQAWYLIEYEKSKTTMFVMWVQNDSLPHYCMYTAK